MRMTKLIIPAIVAATLSLNVMADEVYYDTARVIAVAPQLERVNNPRQECHTEYVRESYYNDRSPLGAIIGGVAGGLLGSQVGRGNGRIAGAAVGAGVGAVVGDRIGNNHSVSYRDRPVESCVTVDNWQTVTRGYLVTYRYHGRDYSTVIDSNPGDSIRVSVAVNPGYTEQRITYLEPTYGRNFDGPSGWDRGHGWDGNHSWDRHHDRDHDRDDD